MDRDLQKLKRRLERWELEHLREHAAELAERLEETERRLASAENDADFWREQALINVNEALDSDQGASHRAIGLTKAGELLVVQVPREFQ